MTNQFVPSSSVDSYTQPMDIGIPLIDPNDSENNHVIQPNLSTTVTKIVSKNVHPRPDPPYFQTPVPKPKQTSLFDRFFPLGQLKRVEFYQALLSEYIATLILVLVATSTGLPVASTGVPDVHGALASGLIVATVVVGFGHVSGAHINPAVTITFLVANEIDFYRALLYIGMQLLGAVSASALVKSITPMHAQNSLGMTMITQDVSLTQAFIVEFFITFILCYTVHAICDKHRDDIGGSKALAVGFAVTVGCLFGGPYTGASMNPARSFGPAVIMGSWKNHWIYWFGPLAGSIVAGLIYTRVLKRTPESAELNKSRTHAKLDKENHI
ncbi:unnamed protein product [Adineta ricciae]|uniref:Uncharacterized protein n=1 Tax=Adineta ricciae TaxID=249248 RepID=A0A813UAA0_ADIRI|nr:unnamed protein product [Adineta ricciae]